jgi:hypothetical protein
MQKVGAPAELRFFLVTPDPLWPPSAGNLNPARTLLPSPHAHVCAKGKEEKLMATLDNLKVAILVADGWTPLTLRNSTR